jgi:uncharacterized protein (TIGR02246 family)
MSEEDEVMALCRRLRQAHEDRDAEGIGACYAPDALIYSLAPPLAERGRDPAATAAWLATWRGPIRLEAEEVELAVSGEMAWMTALSRIRGEKTDGARVDIWFRTTLGFRKAEGAWRIVHDHASTPFYMDGSLKAAVDLTPDSAVRWDSPAA